MYRKIVCFLAVFALGIGLFAGVEDGRVSLKVDSSLDIRWPFPVYECGALVSPKAYVPTFYRFELCNELGEWVPYITDLKYPSIDLVAHADSGAILFGKTEPLPDGTYYKVGVVLSRDVRVKADAWLNGQFFYTHGDNASDLSLEFDGEFLFGVGAASVSNCVEMTERQLLTFPFNLDFDQNKNIDELGDNTLRLSQRIEPYVVSGGKSKPSSISFSFRIKNTVFFGLFDEDGEGFPFVLVIPPTFKVNLKH